MSLINDALKQARRSQQNNPPSVRPPLPPVESVSRGGMSWFLLGAIVLLLAVAGFFIRLSLSKHTLPPPMVAAPATTLTTAPELSPIQQVESVSNVPPISTDASSDSNVVAAVPPPLPPPEPKLQGILFDPTRPCAIVNGITVFVGDRVGEFRVTAISKDKVTLKSGTETKVLSLDR
jgi:hypothetical protein